MALINCKECGREISDQVKNCIHCGFENKNEDVVKIPERIRSAFPPTATIMNSTGNQKWSWRKHGFGCFGILFAIAMIGQCHRCVFGDKIEQRQAATTASVPTAPTQEKKDVSEICGFTISEITMRGTDIYYNVSGYDATSVADATCLKNYILNNNTPTQGLTVHFMDNMPNFRPQGTGMYGSTSAMKKVILQCVTIGSEFEFYFDPLGYGTFAQPQ